MRKIGLLFITIFCLLACKNNSSRISLEGEIKGLTNDTLYLYGTDALYDRIDTIYAEKGKFSYNLNIDSTVIDTLTTAVLLINGHVEYPVFLDKGNQITIKGNIDDLSYLDINGNEPNTSLSLFMKEQRGLGSASDKMMQEKAETFIRQHNSSLASVYLLDKYFVQTPQPDYIKIKEITEAMTGALLDRPYIENISDYIDQLEKVTVGKSAPYFSLPNEKGEKLSRSAERFRNRYLLLNFWASWCGPCIGEMPNVHKAYDLLHDKGFEVISISTDRKESDWRKAMKEKQMEHFVNLRDTKGVLHEIFNRDAIPFILLLDPQGRIVAKELRGKDIYEVAIESMNK